MTGCKKVLYFNYIVTHYHCPISRFMNRSGKEYGSTCRFFFASWRNCVICRGFKYSIPQFKTTVGLSFLTCGSNSITYSLTPFQPHIITLIRLFTFSCVHRLILVLFQELQQPCHKLLHSPAKPVEVQMVQSIHWYLCPDMWSSNGQLTQEKRNEKHRNPLLLWETQDNTIKCKAIMSIWVCIFPSVWCRYLDDDDDVKKESTDKCRRELCSVLYVRSYKPFYPVVSVP